MTLYININFILILTIILACFVNLVLPVGNYSIQLCSLSLYVSLFFIIIFKNKLINYFLFKIVFNRNSLYSPFIAFILYSFILSLTLIIQGKVSLFSFIMPLLGGIVIQIFLSILFSSFLAYKMLKIRTILKIIYTTLFSILVIGIIDFIVCYFNITPLMNIIELFSNEQFFVFGTATPRVYINNIPRVQSIFIEPAIFGGFITIFLPIIYSLSLSKYNCLKNKSLNIIIKKSIIILAWLNLILTQSPIFLIFAIIITLLYFAKHIINFIKKHFSFFSFSIITFIIVLYIISKKIDISETYIKRIFLVIEVLGDFDKFVIVENSLATRIVNYTNALCLWLKSPIFGIGLGELLRQMPKQLINSPLPLTQEIIGILNSNSFTFNTGFFYKYVAETGLIGISLLYFFLFKIIKSLNKVHTILKKGIEKDFCYGIIWFIISFCILSFYNIGYLDLYIWIIIGFAIGFYYKIVASNKYIKEKNDNE